MNHTRILLRSCPLLVAMVFALAANSRAAEASNAPPTTAPSWVDAMRKTHAKFTGTHGTFAHFGDSITVSMAFWSGLPYDHKNLGPEGEKALALVKDYMQGDCWRNWKGPEFGSEGGMQVTWGEQNVDKWLKKLNPEVALIMFGTNDLREGRSVEDYSTRTRAIARKCLDNGTVVILSTIPPRTKKLEESRAYADAVRKLGRELNVPVEDFFQAVISRRPDDWDGSLDAFKGAGDSYDVLTLISRDGVHPSAPKQFAGDYSEQALRNHGYNLRTYITLLAYADLIREVLKP